jgi:hypothetical protein
LSAFPSRATASPSSLAKVKAVKQKGVRGQTIGAVLGTLSDVTMTALSGSNTGLRGGIFTGSLTDMRLHKILYVPGVVVSGRFNLMSGIATVTVSGEGAHGQLVVHRYKKITIVKGMLDGKRVGIRTRTSANDSQVLQRLPGLLGQNLTTRPIS